MSTSTCFTFDWVIKTIVSLRFLRAALGSEPVWKQQGPFQGQRNTVV